jgi:hypothetical protein
LCDAPWRAKVAGLNRAWVSDFADQDREMAQMEQWYRTLAAVPRRTGRPVATEVS